jgi:CheY-like chemotaxis protein/AraC-like DNA-binding protein
VEELMSRDYTTLSESFFEKRMRLIHNSTIRLTDLLNQLLEFRKVEVGKAVLKASEQDVVKYIAMICESYSFLAENKKIYFHSDLPSKSIPLWFEPSKMDVIVNNLLSNAFKYSGTPGKVWVRLTELDEQLVLEVCNDGEGISEGEISKLFDRFYQASGGSRRRGQGSGIGLDLVKRFVEMHRGQITVESQPDVNTCFKVVFLKGDAHLSESEKTVVTKEQENREVVTEREVSREPVRPGQIPRGTRGAKVLIVEDNDQVREYLIDLLGDLFELSVAVDGIAGYTSVIDEMPALVLSDVMMPRSDGYELCARIKKNEKTSHIPVILLTAKDGKDEYLTGTRHGADAYITKPFDPLLLLEKIKQLISSRVILQEKYSRKLTLAPLNIEISKEDEKFIGSVMKIIEKHMGAAALDSEFIAGEVNMSASTFYRKMKKTVGQSPGEFIKSMRMKMAARYLRESDLTVSEIVERVGYSDIRNFRKSFRDEYGISPAEYRKS